MMILEAVFAMTKWHGGKGSGRRKENTKRYEDNWEAIFGKKKKEKKKDANKTKTKRKD